MTSFRSKAPWPILLSAVIAGWAAEAQADGRQFYSLAYRDYIHCNEGAVRKLVEREMAQTTDNMGFGLLFRQVMAAEAMRACSAKEASLTASLPAGLPSDFRSQIQRFNEEVVAAEVGRGKLVKVRAGAEWMGCSMKPIPSWKAGRP